jgi:hypothetical protein
METAELDLYTTLEDAAAQTLLRAAVDRHGVAAVASAAVVRIKTVHHALAGQTVLQATAGALAWAIEHRGQDGAT